MTCVINSGEKGVNKKKCLARNSEPYSITSYFI